MVIRAHIPVYIYIYVGVRGYSYMCVYTRLSKGKAKNKRVQPGQTQPPPRDANTLAILFRGARISSLSPTYF